ncbi:unnamed protein product [Urochloa humidicola]
MVDGQPQGPPTRPSLSSRRGTGRGPAPRRAPGHGYGPPASPPVTEAPSRTGQASCGHGQRAAARLLGRPRCLSAAGEAALPGRRAPKGGSHSQPNGPRGSGRWHSRCPLAGLRPPQLAPAGRPPRAQLQTPLHHVAPHGPPWPCERPREAPSLHLDRLTSPCPLCATALDKATLLLVNGAAAAAQNASHVLATHHMSQAPSVHRSHYLFSFAKLFCSVHVRHIAWQVGRMAAGQRGGDTTTGCPCCSPRKGEKKSRGERRTRRTMEWHCGSRPGRARVRQHHAVSASPGVIVGPAPS